MKVKLCGIRRTEDIEYVNEAMPDYIGYIFAESKRRVTPFEAAAFTRKLHPQIKTVGVFVNENIEKIIGITQIVKLDVIQLHGDEDAAYIEKLKENLPTIEIWKAVRVQSEQDILLANELPVEKLLLDAFSPSALGGTGSTADWAIIINSKAKITKPFFLAGGLAMYNIKNAIKSLAPFGVDISSGIETNGFKDRNKILAITSLIKEIKI